MARSIVLTRDGSTSTFALWKVDRGGMRGGHGLVVTVHRREGYPTGGVSLQHG